MIVYYLFAHKKSVLKRKVCIIFIKNLNKKKTKKNIFNGFFRWVFWVFLGGFFNANPVCRTLMRIRHFRSCLSPVLDIHVISLLH
jgi:hypothetical protein